MSRSAFKLVKYAAGNSIEFSNVHCSDLKVQLHRFRLDLISMTTAKLLEGTPVYHISKWYVEMEQRDCSGANSRATSGPEVPG